MASSMQHSQSLLVCREVTSIPNLMCGRDTSHSAADVFVLHVGDDEQVSSRFLVPLCSTWLACLFCTTDSSVQARLAATGRFRLGSSVLAVYAPVTLHLDLAAAVAGLLCYDSAFWHCTL